MTRSFLGYTGENAAELRLVAFHTRRQPVATSADHLLAAKLALLEVFAGYLEVTDAIAQLRARLAPIVPGEQARAAQLVSSADLLLTGYERDLASIESILRAAEKMVESYDGTTFVSDTVRNYRELLGQLRQQAEDRINLLDMTLFQDILTQYAVQNIVP